MIVGNLMDIIEITHQTNPLDGIWIYRLKFRLRWRLHVKMENSLDQHLHENNWIEFCKS